MNKPTLSEVAAEIRQATTPAEHNVVSRIMGDRWADAIEAAATGEELDGGAITTLLYVNTFLPMTRCEVISRKILDWHARPRYGKVEEEDPMVAVHSQLKCLIESNRAKAAEICRLAALLGDKYVPSEGGVQM